jgi:hypothetical protein
MGSNESRTNRLRAAAAVVLLGSAWSSALHAADSRQGGGAIFTCIDPRGHRLTSDRPIPECIAREQRVLNRDGSVQRIIPPTLTAEERAAAEAAESRRAAQHKAQQDVIRRDRTLLQRYPDEAAHAKARTAALDTVRASVKLSEARLQDLAAERKPLIAETEFYVGKPLPTSLRQQLDANDAATEAQRALVANQQSEIGRINAVFDIELARLRKLWAGAPPGSLGPLETVPSAREP